MNNKVFEKTYHIAYASDHNFIFICAVSILSLVGHADSKHFYEIHLLIDESVSKEDLRLFSRIRDVYENVLFDFLSINNTVIENGDYSYSHLNKMTLYRLLLASNLPNVDICLYLDSDTYIWKDISGLFTLNMENAYLAGSIDSYIVYESGYIPPGLSDTSGYVNAGVLLMNLKKIRDDCLESIFLSHVNKQYVHMDQDILNIVCKGGIVHFDEVYNYFSFRSGKEALITHFVSPSGTRPWDYIYAKYSEEWWEKAKLFQDTEHYMGCRNSALLRYEKERIPYMLNNLNDYTHIYIWGCGGYGIKLLKCLQIRYGKKIDALLDNNAEKWGTLVDDVSVIAPNDIDNIKESCVIISNQNRQNSETIRKQLEKMGYDDDQIFVYKAMNKIALISVDPKYSNKFEDEFWMEYECGVQN